MTDTTASFTPIWVKSRIDGKKMIGLPDLYFILVVNSSSVTSQQIKLP